MEQLKLWRERIEQKLRAGIKSPTTRALAVKLVLAGGPMPQLSNASSTRSGTPDPTVIFELFALFVIWGIFAYMLGAFEAEQRLKRP